MEAVKISEGVYWVGAIDWNLRNFHGYETEKGSTYNAYLVIFYLICLVYLIFSVLQIRQGYLRFDGVTS